jgi:HAD superfamily hydrolase (TIGR01509 family)
MKNSKKLKVKAILFDLDGTIVDSREAYWEALKKAFAVFGQKCFSRNMMMEIPRRLEQNMSLNDILQGVDVQEFLEVYLKAYYEATMEKTKPLPGILDTLEKLSKKAKLSVITMRYVPKEKVIQELERFGLVKYFHEVMTALNTNEPKPSPEALVKCSNRMGIPTCRCAFVGDSVTDVRAGKAAGTRTVAVLSGIFSLEELKRENPDLILENVNRLPDFVE